MRSSRRYCRRSDQGGVGRRHLLDLSAKVAGEGAGSSFYYLLTAGVFVFDGLRRCVSVERNWYQTMVFLWMGKLRNREVGRDAN